ncbi:uncharacterized protein AB675_7624 [Cyphellophora attinorum]|uniref:Zn(2)-C6 fungal-type domain-containing protein n=1 Tax=Cyphellophora attinorum TaxID=1664694 RepID=A0A0N1HUE6_9EURO|nr:uncharacterized protein AB675_7624 [Phialophora attinorum]KPI40532.1 hypothetical protein AB675_7624 [Phialophora attinorum]
MDDIEMTPVPAVSGHSGSYSWPTSIPSRLQEQHQDVKNKNPGINVLLLKNTAVARKVGDEPRVYRYYMGTKGSGEQLDTHFYPNQGKFIVGEKAHSGGLLAAVWSGSPGLPHPVILAKSPTQNKTKSLFRPLWNGDYMSDNFDIERICEPEAARETVIATPKAQAASISKGVAGIIAINEHQSDVVETSQHRDPNSRDRGSVDGTGQSSRQDERPAKRLKTSGHGASRACVACVESELECEDEHPCQHCVMGGLACTVSQPAPSAVYNHNRTGSSAQDFEPAGDPQDEPEATAMLINDNDDAGVESESDIWELVNRVKRKHNSQRRTSFTREDWSSSPVASPQLAPSVPRQVQGETRQGPTATIDSEDTVLHSDTVVVDVPESEREDIANQVSATQQHQMSMVALVNNREFHSHPKELGDGHSFQLQQTAGEGDSGLDEVSDVHEDDISVDSDIDFHEEEVTAPTVPDTARKSIQVQRYRLARLATHGVLLKPDCHDLVIDGADKTIWVSTTHNEVDFDLVKGPSRIDNIIVVKHSSGSVPIVEIKFRGGRDIDLMFELHSREAVFHMVSTLQAIDQTLSVSTKGSEHLETLFQLALQTATSGRPSAIPGSVTREHGSVARDNKTPAQSAQTSFANAMVQTAKPMPVAMAGETTSELPPSPNILGPPPLSDARNDPPVLLNMSNIEVEVSLKEGKPPFTMRWHELNEERWQIVLGTALSSDNDEEIGPVEAVVTDQDPTNGLRQNRTATQSCSGLYTSFGEFSADVARSLGACSPRRVKVK